MANIMIGAAVFVAILCGQPDLLTVLCVYLWIAVAVVAGIIQGGQAPSALHRRHPSPAK